MGAEDIEFEATGGAVGVIFGERATTLRAKFLLAVGALIDTTVDGLFAVGAEGLVALAALGAKDFFIMEVDLAVGAEAVVALGALAEGDGELLAAVRAGGDAHDFFFDAEGMDDAGDGCLAGGGIELALGAGGIIKGEVGATLVTVVGVEGVAVGADGGAGGEFEVAELAFEVEGGVAVGAGVVFVVNGRLTHTTKQLTTFSAEPFFLKHHFVTVGAVNGG